MRAWITLLLIVFLAGCVGPPGSGREFICSDGSIVHSPDSCPRKPSTTSIVTTSTSSTTTTIKPDDFFSFESESGNCGGFANVSIKVIGNKIQVSGSVETPSPCYDLSATHAINETEILIGLSARSHGGICVLCIGSIPFSAWLPEVPPGSYVVRMVFDGKLLLESEVKVPSEEPASSTSTMKAEVALLDVSTPKIFISAVNFDAPGDDRKNLNGEWVEVSNSGLALADFSGWTLSDESGKKYFFPKSFTLSPASSVKVFSGSGANSASHLYWGRNSAVWNNDGDTATLADAEGKIIDSKSA